MKSVPTKAKTTPVKTNQSRTITKAMVELDLTSKDARESAALISNIFAHEPSCQSVCETVILNNVPKDLVVIRLKRDRAEQLLHLYEELRSMTVADDPKGDKLAKQVGDLIDDLLTDASKQKYQRNGVIVEHSFNCTTLTGNKTYIKDLLSRNGNVSHGCATRMRINLLERVRHHFVCPFSRSNYQLRINSNN